MNRAIVCMAVPQHKIAVARLYVVPAGIDAAHRLRTCAKVTTAAIITAKKRPTDA